MIHGLLLAAGAGSRMGVPKALVPDWLPNAVGVLLDGGCDTVTVVLGAAADEAEELLAATPVPPARVSVVRAADWMVGMSASLQAGLRAAAGTGATAVLVHLVDLPDVTAAVVRRVLEEVGEDPACLARATYDGRPGHPVLIGGDHWSAIAGEVVGDEGARRYLAEHATTLVECGDLASGADVDAR